MHLDLAVTHLHLVLTGSEGGKRERGAGGFESLTLAVWREGTTKGRMHLQGMGSNPRFFTSW